MAWFARLASEAAGDQSGQNIYKEKLTDLTAAYLQPLDYFTSFL